MSHRITDVVAWEAGNKNIARSRRRRRIRAGLGQDMTSFVSGQGGRATTALSCSRRPTRPGNGQVIGSKQALNTQGT
jgi:hypothetical protein